MAIQVIKRLGLIVPVCGALLSVPAQAASYTELTLPNLNTNLSGWTDGAVYSAIFPGEHVWNGVPFKLESQANGNKAFMGGVLNIPVNIYGVTSSFTLMNSAWGVAGKTVGKVEFFGSSGVYYSANLLEGSNIRDHFDGSFAGTLDGVNAKPAYNIGAGHSRLDMQIFNLPAEFASQTLQRIRFTDYALGNPNGSAFIAAATVAAVPEPETYAMLLAGLGVVGWSLRKRMAPRTKHQMQ